MATLTLVNAPAGRRLAAKLADLLPAVLVGVVVYLIGGAGSVTGMALTDPGAYLALNAVGQVIVLGYWIWLWGWEATAGKTPGNLILGLRTTGADGLPAGWGRIFLRNLVIGAVSVLPVAGFVLVMLSNLWDRDGQRRGWHDLAARTLVFDVRAGRNPLGTGGVDGPASFAPPRQSQQAPLLPVASPQPGQVISAVPGVEGVRIAFDDGQEEVVRGQALIGRNPAGHDGEMIDQLIGVADEGRSVSKTHVHVRRDGGELWVTDRHSTNGTAMLSADGRRTPLTPGAPTRAGVGSTVVFGDRSFTVVGS